ncbi:afadin [Boleophthalmus pectinirostris]|uniref:afadin n=1 Tax=Boleophthalmus pectinirostris TaxID=150288 RepID=UPI00242E4F76|nr:afadin [Boleophthalmus pectinirostris]
MRFYLEDSSGENIATKCLRVSSVWTTEHLLHLLSEKISPDLKRLSGALCLWEVQAGKERRLEPEERPLVAQLNWNRNNREGRFVLKTEKDKGEKENSSDQKSSVMQNFRRSLSKKDKKKLKTRSTEMSPNRSSSAETKDEHRDPPCLPITVKFSDNTEDSFLCAVINYTNSSTVHFKLSPAFVLYAAARSLLCPKTGSGGRDQGSRVSALTDKMVERMRRVIQRRPSSLGALCFWMSNCCELLHFLKQDSELQPITEQSQRGMSRLLHHAYRSLVDCLQSELMKHLPTFLLEPQTHGALPKGIELVLNTLMTSMSLFRRCKLHAALSIQLFSQLFHFISAWLFNRLLAPQPEPAALCSHHWGATLRHRLSPIEAWAERQGLELAADCHLGLITQATALLTLEPCVQLQKAQSLCSRLRPAQIQALLQGSNYRPQQKDNDWVAGLISAAQSSSDQSPDLPLEESLTLHLPLLLPEHGYCSQTLRGVPPGLTEFMEPVCKRGLCSVSPAPLSSGDWTVHFSDTAPSSETSYLEPHREPDVQTVTLHKPLNSGMGLSIVAAKGAGQSELGIYIKSIVRGGPAEMNGRVSCGDQLLTVDGQSLIGLSQERAVDILMQTGPVVTLQVSKYAAGFHGLEELLRDKKQGKETD